MKFIYTFLLLVASFGFTCTLKLKCPLTWLSSNEITTKSVSSSKFSENYIVKVKLNDENGSAADTSYSIGNLPRTLGFALAPNITAPHLTAEYSVFEILTNPYNCILTWENEPHNDNFLVKVGHNAIGRSVYKNTILPGEVSTVGDDKLIKVATLEDGVINNDSFQYLTCYLTGLLIDPGNVTLVHNDLNVTASLVGLDEIHNQSPISVKQQVEHRTRALESMTLTTWRSWATASRFTFKFSFDINIPIPLPPPVPPELLSLTLTPSFEFMKGDNEEGFDSQTYHKATETSITIGREITVLAHTSVQACSISLKIKDFKGEFTSSDKFYAPGLTGEEVMEILREDGINDGIVYDDHVLVFNNGNIQADLFLTTRFYVSNLGEQGSFCVQLRKHIQNNDFVKSSQ